MCRSGTFHNLHALLLGPTRVQCCGELGTDVLAISINALEGPIFTQLLLVLFYLLSLAVLELLGATQVSMRAIGLQMFHYILNGSVSDVTKRL